MSLRGANAHSVWIDEVFAFEPEPKRIATFTKESKIFRDTFHYASPIMYNYTELAEMRKWCWEIFGDPGYHTHDMKTTWDYTNYPDCIFWFSDEKHLTMFILRWT